MKVESGIRLQCMVLESDDDWNSFGVDDFVDIWRHGLVQANKRVYWVHENGDSISVVIGANWDRKTYLKSDGFSVTLAAR